MTDLATLQASTAARGLRTLGPFPSPTAAIAALHAVPADEHDAARWTAVRTTDAGLLFVADGGEGLDPSLPRQALHELADKRERSDLLATVLSAGLPAGCSVLWDLENLAYFPSPSAAEAWLLRRRTRHAEADRLLECGLWASRGERGVALVAADDGQMLQVSFLLRKKGFLPQFVRDLAGDRQMPFPKSTPPFDADLAAALADQLHETAPGPRRSIEKYVAYLGGYRCRELADLAVELAAHPEWPVADVHARLVALGWNAAGLAEAQPAIDPRVSVYGPRTIGGVWFQLLSKWVGPRLAGWIERQR